MADWGINNTNPTSSVSDPKNNNTDGHLASTVTDPIHDPNNAGFKSLEKQGYFFAGGRWQRKTGIGGVEDVQNPGDTSGLDNWLSGKTSLDGTDSPAVKKQKADAAAAAAAGAGDDISRKMQAFIDSMNLPISKTDPIYQGLLQMGTDAAQKHAGSAGLSGRSTLAGTQAASVAQQNVMPWMMARQQAGQNMQMALSGRDISLAQLAQGQQRINQGLADSQFQATQNTLQGIGSIGGGIIGGIYGGPGGAAAGSSLGAGALSTFGGIGGPNYSSAGQTYQPGSAGQAPKPSGGGGGSSGTGY